MATNLAASFTADRLDRLATPLLALARAAPPGYDGWAELAQQGASAAARGDREEVRAACGACHGAYRQRYRDERRGQPLSIAMVELQ